MLFSIQADLFPDLAAIKLYFNGHVAITICWIEWFFLTMSSLLYQVIDLIFQRCSCFNPFEFGDSYLSFSTLLSFLNLSKIGDGSIEKREGVVYWQAAHFLRIFLKKCPPSWPKKVIKTCCSSILLESMGKDVFNYRPYKSSLKNFAWPRNRFIAKNHITIFWQF